MKKIIAVLTAGLLFAGSAFALDFSADANFAVPLAFTSNKGGVDVNEKNYTHFKTNNTETGIGADAGLKAMLNKTIGVKLDLGFYAPQSLSSKTHTDVCVLGKVTSSDDSGKISYSDLYDSYSSFNLFVGPCISVKFTKDYVLYVTPGLNLDKRTATVKSGDTTYSESLTYWGLGADFQLAYRLSKSVYLNLDCPVVYNFKTVDENDKENDTKGLYIVPKIGIGYKF